MKNSKNNVYIKTENHVEIYNCKMNRKQTKDIHQNVNHNNTV